jgi:CRP-like cAMP-binding protein
MGTGELVGEMGIFSPERSRTQTVLSEADAELYYMTDEMMSELYYQHPKLGFYLMQLLVTRLIADVQRHQTRPAAA